MILFMGVWGGWLGESMEGARVWLGVWQWVRLWVPNEFQNGIVPEWECCWFGFLLKIL